MNLKWNVDGLGRVPPPAKHLDFVRKKRMEFVWLGITTCVSSIALACCIVFLREHNIKLELFLEISSWNVAGVILGGIVSFLA